MRECACTVHRGTEKLEIQLAKSRMARMFNLRYLANDVTSKTLQIKWKSNKFEQAIMKKAESSIQDKWVINLSKKELTPKEKSFTTERPKICSYPSNHHHQKYISITTVGALQTPLHTPKTHLQNSQRTH